ncbi:NADAR family protein [Parathalassolituus penaei]|uniref:NADAR family protein n=1 Tax=Parathalassolituus penaei TaxID=2997323 RepID=A0A9X3EAC8_9GAMM|nr:NADAR family protein [Parathalassolituus penaei]MCY0963914.1 NADAR family protein [Parathalassolituus penaei]
MFFPEPGNKHYVVRDDANDPLSAYSRFGFELDDAEWPTVEHYYQGMKFEKGPIRDAIRIAENAAQAVKLAKANKKAVRKDWDDVRKVMMTRAIYIKCRTHPEVAAALLKTGTDKIVENSMYDYYWGCGRDGRGHNTYGVVLMAVRDKLLQEQGSVQG